MYAEPIHTRPCRPQVTARWEAAKAITKTIIASSAFWSLRTTADYIIVQSRQSTTLHMHMPKPLQSLQEFKKRKMDEMQFVRQAVRVTTADVTVADGKGNRQHRLQSLSSQFSHVPNSS
jgi:hypothetical protein